MGAQGGAGGADAAGPNMPAATRANGAAKPAGSGKPANISGPARAPIGRGRPKGAAEAGRGGSAATGRGGAEGTDAARSQQDCITEWARPWRTAKVTAMRANGARRKLWSQPPGDLRVKGGGDTLSRAAP